MSRRSGIPDELLIGTTNPAKARRLRWVFADLGFRFRDLPPLAGEPPDECGSSFGQNAQLKSQFWSKQFAALAAASDGGLVIPALGSGWDALRTARAAGPGAGDFECAEHLLAQAADLVGDQRRVYWTEALSLALNGEPLASWEARGAEAVLVERLDPAQLVPGFWAGSLCYLPSHRTTLARLSDQQLGQIDQSWAHLRDEVRAYFGLRQSDLSRSV